MEDAHEPSELQARAIATAIAAIAAIAAVAGQDPVGQEEQGSELHGDVF